MREGDPLPDIASRMSVRMDTEAVGRTTIAVSEVIDARRAIGFAAAVAGNDAVYFDDAQENGPPVHPAIAFSLQWQSRSWLDQPMPERALPMLGVHAGTVLRLHGPFEIGQAITTQGRLIARRQIMSGVYDVERYRMTDGRGELLAEMDFNLIYRHAVLEGDGVQLEDIAVAPEPTAASGKPIELTHRVTQASIHQYTECARIYAAIHTQRSVASALGLPNIILHGSATQAIALSHVITAAFGDDPRRITGVYGQLRAVVLPDSEIVTRIAAIEDVGDERRVFFTMDNGRGDLAIAHGLATGRN